ncbi:sperm acrosome-associated protein 9 isoform X2 [Xyrauchen texanus]|uniref:sperm acrosome-associated protein 9 isoform X2 n=1 Tax=Xyrauchen texanus TaxID=154827 RepID=UPI00224236CA|nr:sperm acrosome-associated protein 9 isoform X2 [Xyrauchen texanus]
MSTPVDMTDVKEQLHSTEEKYKRFKQQQFIFITALERSREHARDKTEPVSTVTQSSWSSQNTFCKTLETCKELLSPSNNINELRAHYPHSEINRLSCDEAKNFYGGIVSLIPLALDHLTAYFKGGAQPVTPTVTETSTQQTEAKSIGMSADLDKATSNNSTSKKGTGGWHAGKPAWKPPGQTRH